MRTLVRKLLPKLPPGIRADILEHGRRYQDRNYVKQGSTRIRVGEFELSAPKGHLLVGANSSQPYRDLAVGIVAKFVAEKYRTGTVVDIGANIGDTAAIIASYSNHRIVLVEPSDFFYGFLEENVKQLPNEVHLKRVLVSTGQTLTGTFHYRGGTAYFHEDSDGKVEAKSEKLCEIADQDTHFVKVDTDGYDVRILSSSLEWLRVHRPAIMFENSIQSEAELEETNRLFDDLAQAGYWHFVVWDDPGFHIVSTGSLDVIKDLNRYLFKLKEKGFSRAVSNYDVLCVHDTDTDIYEQVSAWYREY